MPKLQARSGLEHIAAHMVSAEAAGLPPVTTRLDSNESAFGPSPRARTAMQAALEGIERYVETPVALLAPVLAARDGLDPARIVVGHGSDDLLARLARAYLRPGDELLRFARGYAKVPNYAHANDAVPVSVEGDGFATSVDALLAGVTDRTRIVYVANPENPTGSFLTGAELRRLHAGLPDNVLLIIDAAYEDYVSHPGAEPSARMVEDFDNVAVTRTFSKVQGLAGARVGWMYAAPAIVQAVTRIGTTFPLSTPAIAGAIAALEDRAHSDFVAAETLRLRDRTTAALEAMDWQVEPSQANFLLTRPRSPHLSAEAAWRILRAQGIAVRRFPAPAFAAHLRITLGTEAELDRALAALRACRAEAAA